MNNELRFLHDRLLRTTTPEQLFGVLVGDQHAALKHTYRQFVRVTHEDVYPLEEDKLLARAAFVALQRLFETATKRLDDGTYGKTNVTLASVKTKLATYKITEPFAGGDLSSIYKANDGTRDVLLKISRASGLNDLLDNEAKALKAFHHDTQRTKSYKLYAPELIETARVAPGGKNDVRTLNVLSFEPGWVPLTEVLSFHPDGVDPRHAVWIFKRLLTAISVLNAIGVVHGAVLPPHVLVHPESHGLRLVDWSYSVPHGQSVKAISRAWKELCAPEVLLKIPAKSTDVYMAAKTTRWVMNVNATPPPIMRFIDSCMLHNPARRPSNAWGLYENFAQIAQDVYGKPKFVPLVLAEPS